MLSLFKRRNQQSDLTAVALQAEGVAIAQVAHGGARPRLQRLEFRAWDSAANDPKTLARVAHDFGLKRARCATVLAPDDYKLLLAEAPDVKADELKAAVRWRIKDLIDFHINDATLDVFELPNVGAAGGPRSMYAAVARKQTIQARVDLLETAGMNLDVIDIPELAQRNLAALTPQDANGVVLLSLYADGGLLTVTKQAQMYFSRTIDVGFNALRESARAADYFDRIALEVQRSLDYYDSHFRQAPLAQLLIAPVPDEIPGLVDHLNANLGIKAAMLDLSAVLDFGQPAPADVQWRCLTAVGAALRREHRAL